MTGIIALSIMRMARRRGAAAGAIGAAGTMTAALAAGNPCKCNEEAAHPAPLFVSWPHPRPNWADKQG